MLLRKSYDLSVQNNNLGIIIKTDDSICQNQSKISENMEPNNVNYSKAIIEASLNITSKALKSNNSMFNI